MKCSVLSICIFAWCTGSSGLTNLSGAYVNVFVRLGTGNDEVSATLIEGECNFERCPEPSKLKLSRFKLAAELCPEIFDL